MKSYGHVSFSSEWALRASPAQTPCVKGVTWAGGRAHQIDSHETALRLLELTILLGEHKTHANPSLLTTCPCIYGCWLILSWSITPRSCVVGVRMCFLKAVKGKLSFSKWSWVPICAGLSFTPAHTLVVSWARVGPLALPEACHILFTQTVATKDIGFSSSSWQPRSFSRCGFNFYLVP